MAGTLSSVKPRSWICWRVVISGAQLPAVGEAVWHPHAHHKFAGSGLAKEDAHPFQQVLLRRGERFVAAFDQGGQIFANAQPIAADASLQASIALLPGRTLSPPTFSPTQSKFRRAKARGYVRTGASRLGLLIAKGETERKSKQLMASIRASGASLSACTERRKWLAQFLR